MRSVMNVLDGQEIESEYDLPGTRYWIMRTGKTAFKVVGWCYRFGTWFVGDYLKLTHVFSSCIGDVVLTAENMVDGGRAVLTVIRREAA